MPDSPDQSLPPASPPTPDPAGTAAQANNPGQSSEERAARDAELIKKANAGTDAAGEKAGQVFLIGDLSKKADEAFSKAFGIDGGFSPKNIGGAIAGNTGSFVKLATAGTPFASLGGKAGDWLDKKLGTPNKKKEADAKAAAAAKTEPATAANTAGFQDKKLASTDHLISLTEVSKTAAYSPNNQVVFEVMPDIVEQRQVQYEPVAPPQFPGAFQKYKGTDSVQWNITATFVARNSLEASRNLAYLKLLRGWTQPFFGQRLLENTRPDYVGPPFSGALGAPPPVLIFKGYHKSMIGPVPVVITGLNWSWPKDVDYIQAQGDGFSLNVKSIDEFTTLLDYAIFKGETNTLVPFPTVMTVTINLVESFSVSQFNNFDLVSYHAGDMVGAYSRPSPAKPQPVGATPTAQTVAAGNGLKVPGAAGLGLPAGGLKVPSVGNLGGVPSGLKVPNVSSLGDIGGGLKMLPSMPSVGVPDMSELQSIPKLSEMPSLPDLPKLPTLG